jgi:hypothetical protein
MVTIYRTWCDPDASADRKLLVCVCPTCIDPVSDSLVENEILGTGRDSKLRPDRTRPNLPECTYSDICLNVSSEVWVMNCRPLSLLRQDSFSKNIFILTAKILRLLFKFKFGLQHIRGIIGKAKQTVLSTYCMLKLSTVYVHRSENCDDFLHTVLISRYAVFNPCRSATSVGTPSVLATRGSPSLTRLTIT